MKSLKNFGEFDKNGNIILPDDWYLFFDSKKNAEDYYVELNKKVNSIINR